MLCGVTVMRMRSHQLLLLLYISRSNISSAICFEIGDYENGIRNVFKSYTEREYAGNNSHDLLIAWWMKRGDIIVRLFRFSSVKPNRTLAKTCTKFYTIELAVCV